MYMYVYPVHNTYTSVIYVITASERCYDNTKINGDIRRSDKRSSNSGFDRDHSEAFHDSASHTVPPPMQSSLTLTSERDYREKL